MPVWVVFFATVVCSHHLLGAQPAHAPDHPLVLVSSICSCDGLVLLVEPEGEQRSTSDLLNLEAHTWNITDGVTGTTETSNEHLVVLIDEGHATITGHVASNSLVVLLQLHANALTHGRVGLLSLDTNLLDDDAGGLGGTSERLLPLGDGVGLCVCLIGPSVT